MLLQMNGTFIGQIHGQSSKYLTLKLAIDWLKLSKLKAFITS